MPEAKPKEKPKTISYKYHFQLPDGEKTFTIQLEEGSLKLIAPPRDSYPEWAQLANKKCTNCPLSEGEHPRCPAAASIVEVIETFANAVSRDDVLIRVETADRDYVKRVPLQKAISGLIGLLMVASGCPILAKLRPLIRHHLPFANLEETQFRILSMYLMAQFLRSRRGLASDWKLEELGKLYKEIGTVNECFTSRLLSATKGDASLNAMVILEAFTQAVSWSVQGQMLDDLELMFKIHLE